MKPYLNAYAQLAAEKLHTAFCPNEARASGCGFWRQKESGAALAEEYAGREKEIGGLLEGTRAILCARWLSMRRSALMVVGD
jgi:hypothetical protein